MSLFTLICSLYFNWKWLAFSRHSKICFWKVISYSGSDAEMACLLLFLVFIQVWIYLIFYITASPIKWAIIRENYYVSVNISIILNINVKYMCEYILVHNVLLLCWIMRCDTSVCFGKESASKNLTLKAFQLQFH